VKLVNNDLEAGQSNDRLEKDLRPARFARRSRPLSLTR